LAAVPLPAAVGLGARRRRAPLLRLLGFLLGLLIVTAPVPAGADDRPVRLVTFNLLHGGPWTRFTGDDQHLERRLAMIVEDLRAIDPDVVALQESPVTRRHGDVAARLAQALGLPHVVHARATERVFGPRWLGRLIVGALGFVEGPAILSRFPITASEIHDLPRCQRWLDPRVALRADLATPAGAVAVFSTHTSRDDCQTRRVAELAGAVPGHPAVVMGDLNTGDTAPVLAAFSDHGFVDAFRVANPAAPGPTVWQRIDASAATVQRRVDYVFVRAGGGVAAGPVSGRVVLNTPRPLGDGAVLWPSDHYGVLVEVDLLRPASAR
jgi:endonuclease/exonuclease/phosphatase family metal-dependent hydrolase